VSLPGEASGFLPADIAANRTGLYSLAIGQHTLLATPLQCANMLAALANGGTLITPRIVNLVVGREHLDASYEFAKSSNFPYKYPLSLVGIDFALFSKADSSSSRNEVEVPPIAEAKTLFLPKEIQKSLLEGLRRVMEHIAHDRSGALKRLSVHRPDQYRAFCDLRPEFIGKTSTAESQEKIGIDIGQPSIIYNHTWFGGIAYKDDEPELVVVVYQRFGGYGREAAPVAAQVIKKWRQIQNSSANKLLTAL
jgi:cell division protein FtsI/penicillin-binding protein 2